MRVIAGTARSIPLRTQKGDKTRPTTDRTKETLFNILNPFLYNAHFLDLFSGSGAIGIEALSRGADRACFIEKDSEAIACISENLIKTRLSDKAQVFKKDVIKGLEDLKDKGYLFDIIFMDPPYLKGLQEAALRKIFQLGLLKEDGLIICEGDIKEDYGFLTEFPRYSLDKEKLFKTNKFTFIKKL